MNLVMINILLMQKIFIVLIYLLPAMVMWLFTRMLILQLAKE